MRFLISVVGAGFLFLWGLTHIPHFVEYIMVGIVIVIIAKLFK